MVVKEFEVTDPLGVHARQTTIIVHIVSRFKSEINIEYDGKRLNLKSIMGVLSLGIRQGTIFTVIADGTDEAEALEAIQQTLIDNKIAS